MTELQSIIVFNSHHIVRHLGICYRICVKLLQLMSDIITHNSVKINEVSVLKMAELRPNIVFHGRHFVLHLWICNPICVKLLKVIPGVIPSNFKKNDFSISNHFPEVHKRSIHTQTHTHTDTNKQTHTYRLYDSIRRNAMPCISPKN